MIKVCGHKIVIPTNEWKRDKNEHVPVRIIFDRELEEFWMYLTPKSKAYIEGKYGITLEDDAITQYNRKVKSPVPLYQFQEDAIKRAKEIPGYGYILRPGLGKTMCILSEVMSLEAEKRFKNGRVLVLCPKTVKVTWEEHLNSHGKRNWAYSCISIQKRKNPSVTWMVCTYEYMVAHRDALWEFLNNGPSMMVCDESTHIKNQEAKRTQTALQMSEAADFRRILTGTFYANDFRDAWSQLNFLDPAIAYHFNFRQFKNYFGIWTGFKNSDLVGIRNREELQAMVESVCSIVKEAEGLPPRIYETVRFDLSNEAKEVYKKASNELLIELEGNKTYTAADLAVMSSKLRQISGGAYYVGDSKNKDKDKEWRPIGNDKLYALSNVLDESAGYKTVVWCEFSHEISRIKMLVRNKGFTCGSIQGCDNEKSRQGVMKCFNEGDTQILVIQNTVGAMGINLQAANIAIVYSNPRYALIREQMDYRCWRIGQNRSVTIIDLIAKGTLDSYIRNQVLKKVKSNVELLDRKGLMAILKKGEL